jgi:hypothetical protein
MRNEEVLQRVHDKGNTLHTVQRRNVNCTGHFLRRNWLLKHIVERKIERWIEATGKRGRRRRQPLDDP